MKKDKDIEQDLLIKNNEERISRNEEAIRRQTEALEKIRDHYYPPPMKWWRKIMVFAGKVICVIVAYLGVAEALDWIWNASVSEGMAREYAAIAKRIFIEDGNASIAADCYRKAVELDGGEMEYKVDLGLMNGIALASRLLDIARPLTDDERAQVEKAQIEAIVLKKEDPESALPCVMMSQVMLLRGEMKSAVDEIELAIARKPGDAYIRVFACAIYFFAKQPEKARANLTEAQRLDANLPGVLTWRGILAQLLDCDNSVARAYFEEAVRRVPRNPQANAFLGRVILAAPDPDIAAARKYFKRALQFNPKHLIALMGMAETYEHEGKNSIARIWLDHLIAADANNLAAKIARARVAGKLGDNKAAIADLTSAIAISPFRADLYRLRAESYGKDGDTARAKADLATVAELE